jgi:hypothetical protein
MLQKHTRVAAASLAGAAMLLAALPARGQDVGGPVAPAADAAPEPGAPAPAADASLQELWEDMIHYLRRARPDLARPFANAILGGPFEDRELHRMAQTVRGSRAELTRARRLEPVKALVEKLLARVDSGFEQERSDPQWIGRLIEKLGGTLSQFQYAAKRLTVSGEYAVPQLLMTLTDPQAPEALKVRAIAVLPRLGKPAVRPLSVALQTSDPKLQEVLANALGEIAYPHAAPRLRELLGRDDLVERVRRAARAALVACAGEAALRKTEAELFYEFALKYYGRADSLRADAAVPKANVWYWDADVGVDFRPVPREIFCDVYAMRMARLALQHDPTFYPAVSLWLSAIVRKEIDLPAGQADPTWPDDRRGARFHLLAAGAEYQQRVLQRALGDHNAAAATMAIEALADTAGAASLVEALPGGAQPLVAALTYPELRVRMLAALTLARAMPRRRFAGADLVMPILNTAFRISGKPRAALVATESDLGNRLKGLLRDADWVVLHRPDVSAAVAAAREAGGADIVVVATAEAGSVTARLRQEAIFATLPAVAVLANGRTEGELGRVVAVPPDADDEAIAAAIAQAGKMTEAGAMPEAEAGRWAIQAANAVRALALTGTEVYDLDLTLPLLAEVLGDRRADVRLAAAGALAAMPAAEAQRAIGRLALDAGADEAVRVEALRLCTESVRRFEPMLTDDQAQAVLDIVAGEGAPALRQRAAQLHGALSRASEKISSLILRPAK